MGRIPSVEVDLSVTYITFLIFLIGGNVNCVSVYTLNNRIKFNCNHKLYC